MFPEPFKARLRTIFPFETILIQKGCNMELFNQIQTIAQKHGLEKFITKSQDIMNDIPLIQIGFLGEFSSGKSTLINAMIGEKILPAMEKPTSKTIVHVTPVSGHTERKYYTSDENADEWSEITAYDFSEIAMGNQPGGPLKVVTEAKGILKDGYVFVDTPGISSLNESDYDITFGCLPFLDGIVLCVDIGKGSLTQSILKFLAKKEVQPLLNQIVVAINMADNKPHGKHLVNIR